MIVNIYEQFLRIIFPLILLTHILFPYFLNVFVCNVTNKIKSKIIVYIIDCFMLLLYFILGLLCFVLFYTIIMIYPMTNVNFTIIFYLIGFIGSLFYSLLMNFKLLYKYIEKVNLIKYKKLIFHVILCLFIVFTVFCFSLPIFYL